MLKKNLFIPSLLILTLVTLVRAEAAGEAALPQINHADTPRFISNFKAQMFGNALKFFGVYPKACGIEIYVNPIVLDSKKYLVIINRSDNVNSPCSNPAFSLDTYCKTALDNCTDLSLADNTVIKGNTTLTQSGKVMQLGFKPGHDRKDPAAQEEHLLVEYKSPEDIAQEAKDKADQEAAAKAKKDTEEAAKKAEQEAKALEDKNLAICKKAKEGDSKEIDTLEALIKSGAFTDITDEQIEAMRELAKKNERENKLEDFKKRFKQALRTKDLDKLEDLITKIFDEIEDYVEAQDDPELNSKASRLLTQMAEELYPLDSFIDDDDILDSTTGRRGFRLSGERNSKHRIKQQLAREAYKLARKIDDDNPKAYEGLALMAYQDVQRAIRSGGVHGFFGSHMRLNSAFEDMYAYADYNGFKIDPEFERTFSFLADQLTKPQVLTDKNPLTPALGAFNPQDRKFYGTAPLRDFLNRQNENQRGSWDWFGRRIPQLH